MSRFIDPIEHVKRTNDEALGYVPQREMVLRQERQERVDAQSDRTQRLIVFETLEYVIYDVPANADTAISQMFAASASAISLSSINIDIGQQCRVVALRIASNAAVTAGTVVPYITVTEGGSTTDYGFNECELSSLQQRFKSVVFDWSQSIQVAKGASFSLFLRTSAAFAPTTLDMKIHLTFGYEQWVPS